MDVYTLRKGVGRGDDPRLEDQDSGYHSLSRPSTCYSTVTRRTSQSASVIQAETTPETSSNIFSNQKQDRPFHWPSSQALGNPQTRRPKSSPAQMIMTERVKANRPLSSIEPHQLSKWKAHMASVSSKIDSRYRKTDHLTSRKSADMLKQRATVFPMDDICDDSKNKVSGDSDERNPPSVILDQRSESRLSRSRPWRSPSAQHVNCDRRKPGGHVEIHYQKSLPVDRWLECKPKKYVTNHRYGNHYEVRLTKRGKPPKCPSRSPGFKFLWENNCQLWLMEKLNSVDFSTQRKRLEEAEAQEEAKRKAEEYGWNSSTNASSNTTKRPKTAPVTSREVKTEQQRWVAKLANSEDKANVFDQFVEWSMQNQKRRHAAKTIQKFVKGFLVRQHIKKLKERCMKKHGCSWTKFCSDYKGVLARIQRRCGEPKPSCPVTYHDIEKFMEKKEKYEAVFHEMSGSNKTLERKEVMNFFKNCGLFPLEREVDAAFRSVFKGCGVQVDVVFLLDCSVSIGSHIYNMQLNLIKDVISHCEVSYDKIRVAVVPYNDNVCCVIDFDSYGSKNELLMELDALTYERVLEYGKITRTDLALKCMTELVEKVYKVSDHIRDGSQIPKICFAFTDGKCYHTQLTSKWAEYAIKKLKVTMFAITCSKEDPTNPGLFKTITDKEENILSLTDYRTLVKMKSIINQQECLKSCPLCHYGKGIYGEEAKRCGNDKRGLYKHELLELVWMIFCPPATGLKKYKESLWMSPQIETDKPLKLTRYHPTGTDFRACLRTAVEERIENNGKVILPTETGVRVREITDPDLAMDFIEQICVSKLSKLGLVEKAGIDVKPSRKFI